jgi:hypothetical protein
MLRFWLGMAVGAFLMFYARDQLLQIWNSLPW